MTSSIGFGLWAKIATTHRRPAGLLFFHAASDIVRPASPATYPWTAGGELAAVRL